MSVAAPVRMTDTAISSKRNFTRTGLPLQRKCTCGSAAELTGECAECAKNRLQKKLSIGVSNDPLEQEADRVADQVMAMSPNPAVSHVSPRIQRFSGYASEQTGEAPASVEQVVASSGAPLAPVLQHDMEQRFNYDFASVRIHAGEAADCSARDIGANAYTVGNHIAFAARQYSPNTKAGGRLLAHELTHVIQQSNRVQPKLIQRDDKVERHANLRLQHTKRLGQTRVDAAIELTRRAIIYATDTPPNSEHALDILHKVEMFLSPFVTDTNLLKHYGGFTGIGAQEIARGGVSAVKSLQGMIRTGMNASEHGRNGGLWDYHFSQLAIAREYLLVLSGEQERTIAHWGVDEKITAAIQKAIPKLPGEVGNRLKELLTPQSLALIAAFAAAYVFSQTTPIGWVADIVVGALIVATVVMVGQEAIDVVKLLISFVDRAVNAKSEEDLDAAGQDLATAISKVGVDIVVAILLHKAGKAANLKPPGPRSPGLIEAVKTTGEKITSTVTQPATSGVLVTSNGVQVWTPGDPAPASMMVEAKGGASPKGSGAGSGKGSPSSAGKAPGEGKATAPAGRDLAAAGGLPKKSTPSEPHTPVDKPASTGASSDVSSAESKGDTKHATTDKTPTDQTATPQSSQRSVKEILQAKGLKEPDVEAYIERAKSPGGVNTKALRLFAEKATLEQLRRLLLLLEHEDVPFTAELQKLIDQAPSIDNAINTLEKTFEDTKLSASTAESSATEDVPARSRSASIESAVKGTEHHELMARQRRASGNWTLVDEPIKDKGGNPIRVPKQFDAQGNPKPGTDYKSAQPDAVSVTRGEILDDKPMGSPLKYRDQMIGYIRAFEQAYGVLPKKIIIQWYNPETFALTAPSTFTPDFFLH
jgi:Domain of unknown function (DUF4157)